MILEDFDGYFNTWHIDQKEDTGYCRQFMMSVDVSSVIHTDSGLEYQEGSCPSGYKVICRTADSLYLLYNAGPLIDYQLSDLENYCTGSLKGSILSSE